MKKIIQKGFTLIELLVVIAIIGILAGVLFVAIDPSSKIDSARDAETKAGLSKVPTSATMIYTDDNYSYDAVCDKPGVGINSTSISNLGGYDCNDSVESWIVEADKISDTGTIKFCIDSTGAGLEEINSARAVSFTTCN